MFPNSMLIDKLFLIVGISGVLVDSYIDFFYRFISIDCMKRGGCKNTDSAYCANWMETKCERSFVPMVYFITINWISIRGIYFIFNYTEPIYVVAEEVIAEEEIT